MRERSVTRAAERLGPDAIGGQPFAVATARPTGRSTADQGRQAHGAHRLRAGVHRAGAAASARHERVLSPRHRFDPATSRRVFRLAAPDFALGAVHRPACGSAQRGARRFDRMDRPARDDAAGGRGGAGRHRHSRRPAPPARGRCRRGYRCAGMAMLRPSRPSGVPEMGRQGVGALAAPGRPGGRSAREPGQRRRRRGRPRADDRRMGAQLLGHRAGPGRVRSSGHLAGARHGRHAAPLRPRDPDACLLPSIRSRMSCCGAPRAPRIPRSPGCAIG